MEEGKWWRQTRSGENGKSKHKEGKETVRWFEEEKEEYLNVWLSLRPCEFPFTFSLSRVFWKRRILWLYYRARPLGSINMILNFLHFNKFNCIWGCLQAPAIETEQGFRKRLSFSRRNTPLISMRPSVSFQILYIPEVGWRRESATKALRWERVWVRQVFLN